MAQVVCYKGVLVEGVALVLAFDMDSVVVYENVVGTVCQDCIVSVVVMCCYIVDLHCCC